MIDSITFSRVHLNFAGALKKLREKKGLSQGDVFRRTGLERTYISRIEHGEVMDPRITTVVILAKALDMSVDEFVDEMIAMGEKKEATKGGGLSKKG